MTISLLLFPRSTRLSLIDPATWTTRLSARGCDRDKSPTSREATPVRSADWTTGKPPRGGPYRAEVPLLSLPLSFSLPHPSLPPQPPSHPSRPFHSISLSISVLLCSFLFHRLSVFYSSTFFPPVRDTRYFLYSSSLSCFKLALWKVNPSPGIPFSLPLSLSASLLRFIHPLSRCSYSCLYLFCHQLGLLRCSELYHPLFFSLFYYPVTFIHVMAVMGICTLQKETQVVMIPRSCALSSGATPILLLHQGRFRLNCCILDANKCFVPFLFFLLLVLFFKL